MRKVITILSLLALSLPALAQFVIPGEVDTKLSGVWAETTPQQRFKAIRVAEMDAMAQLAERLYGFEITAGTRVYDFMLASDQIDTQMKNLLRGASETKEINGQKAPLYLDNGIVYVGYEVSIRKVYEIIESHVRKSGDRVLAAEYERRIEVRDRTIHALGNGALPGSQGHRRIIAKRAAELDAFRKMAERVLGVQITRQSRVEDFVLASDEISASLSAALKALTPTNVDYDQQDACSVEVQLKVRKVYEIIDRTVRQHKDGFRTRKEVVTKISEKVEDQVFKVTGKGAPRQTAAALPARPVAEPYTEERMIIKRLVREGVVVD